MIRCRGPNKQVRTSLGLLQNTPFGAFRRGSDGKGSEGTPAGFRLRKVYSVHLLERVEGYDIALTCLARCKGLAM